MSGRLLCGSSSVGGRFTIFDFELTKFFIIVANSLIVCSSGLPILTGDVISFIYFNNNYPIYFTWVHKSDKSFNEVVDILEASCLWSLTINSYIFLLKRLKNKIRDNSSIFHVHSGSEIKYHLDVHWVCITRMYWISWQLVYRPLLVFGKHNTLFQQPVYLHRNRHVAQLD